MLFSPAFSVNHLCYITDHTYYACNEDQTGTVIYLMNLVLRKQTLHLSQQVNFC